MRILDLVNEHNWFGRMQPMLQILKKYECFCIPKFGKNGQFSVYTMYTFTLCVYTFYIKVSVLFIGYVPIDPWLLLVGEITPSFIWTLPLICNKPSHFAVCTLYKVYSYVCSDIRKVCQWISFLRYA